MHNDSETALLSQRHGKQCPKDAVTDPQYFSLGSSVDCVTGEDQTIVTIKPEYFLEPRTERFASGGKGLTLMTAHNLTRENVLSAVIVAPRNLNPFLPLGAIPEVADRLLFKIPPFQNQLHELFFISKST